MQTIGPATVISTRQNFTAAIANFGKSQVSAQPIRNYEAEAGRSLPPTSSSDCCTTMAIQRWLSKGNVTLEFYSSNDAGGIRVKIIFHNSNQVSRDLSMQAFLSVPPGIQTLG